MSTKQSCLLTNQLSAGSTNSLRRFTVVPCSLSPICKLPLWLGKYCYCILCQAFFPLLQQNMRISSLWLCMNAHVWKEPGLAPDLSLTHPGTVFSNIKLWWLRKQTLVCSSGVNIATHNCSNELLQLFFHSQLVGWLDKRGRIIQLSASIGWMW